MPLWECSVVETREVLRKSLIRCKDEKTAEIIFKTKIREGDPIDIEEVIDSQLDNEINIEFVEED